MFNTILFALGVLLVCLEAYRRKWTSKSLHLPPGPPLLPFIGRMMPKKQQWLTFAAWGKEFGDVVHLKVMRYSIIILNSQRAALDLLDKKSSNFSSRPYLRFSGEMIGWGNILVLTPYNRRFRDIRKHLHQFMGAHSVKRFWPLQEEHAKAFIHRIFLQRLDPNTTASVTDSIHWMTGSLILLIAYGYKSAPTGDPLVEVVNEAMEQFSRASEPGVWLVDLIPWLKHVPTWFPGAQFHHTAAKWRLTLNAMANDPFEMVKQEISAGIGRPSFTRDLLVEKGQNLSTEEEVTIKWAAASLYSGGADTVASALSSFFLAMTQNPRVLRRAQEELDSVLLGERLPNVDDKIHGRFPYISALVKEVLRWAPVAPTGGPHVSEKDDQYRGWLIPGGSIVFVNIWGLTHDEEVYPNPNEFRPERFLTKTNGGDCETEKDLPRDPGEMVFGYGRRTCPGRHLADTSLWLTIAMSLSTFDIVGHSQDVGYSGGSIIRPNNFECVMTPRSEKAALLLQSISQQMADDSVPEMEDRSMTSHG
ncbi:cytochrome P450 [Sistotremastrum suecicum HHB10207 ss-3]|uniref:Cytochrome P450 n=1 Tax=Sistotremastrum suecicum HHB10207 ss-3 TaxID=1314776 RepID=A0A166HAR8_9AGAM|nr:cytochrome P450 [Sistotremastrum suecicum HHB10207 ss-3]